MVLWHEKSKFERSKSDKLKITKFERDSLEGNPILHHIHWVIKTYMDICRGRSEVAPRLWRWSVLTISHCTIWDHAIKLLPNAPATLPACLLPLNQKEQGEMRKFVEEHLTRGTIQQS
jgi:hypothetical protein